MRTRPRDLADQMAITQTFKLPLDAARRKVREIIYEPPQSGFTSVVEKWRQLPDGQIEFALRHFPVAD